MREKITADLKTAMKAGDRARVDALRLINAGLKDKDIEARGAGKNIVGGRRAGPSAKNDQEPAGVARHLRKEQPSRTRRQGALRDRGDLQLSAEPNERAEVADAIRATVAELGATSIKDMGKVVAALKAKYAGRMDFGNASAVVKAALTG